MTSVPRLSLLTLGVLAWGAVLFATTLLHRLEVDLGAGICGPWGCSANPQALVGYHAFWLVLLVPAVVCGCQAMTPPWGSRVALASLVSGIAVAVAIVGWAAGAWMLAHGAEHAVQRGLFVLATTTDVPAAPLAVAGLVACQLVRKPHSAPVATRLQPEEANHGA